MRKFQPSTLRNPAYAAGLCSSKHVTDTYICQPVRHTTLQRLDAVSHRSVVVSNQ